MRKQYVLFILGPLWAVWRLFRYLNNTSLAHQIAELQETATLHQKSASAWKQAAKFHRRLNRPLMSAFLAEADRDIQEAMEAMQQQESANESQT